MKKLFFISLISFSALLPLHGIKFENERIQCVGNCIPIINVVDSAFFIVLDEVIEYEKTCSYYSDTLSYELLILKGAVYNSSDSVIVFKFEGNEKQDMFIEQDGWLLGHFYYNGHKFFVRGRNLLPESFIITNEKKAFKIDKNFSPSEDDSWAIYQYVFYGGKFIFYDKINDFRCNK